MFKSEQKTARAHAIDAAYRANNHFDRAQEVNQSINDLVKDLGALTPDEIIGLAKQIANLRRGRDTNRSMFRYESDQACEWFSKGDDVVIDTIITIESFALAMQQRQETYLSNQSDCGSLTLNNLNA